MSSKNWGAALGDWAAFRSWGIVADLLPVVSNPGAIISPQSKMRDLGKTPSRYSRGREVVGIPAWTSIHATEAEIGRWSAEPDLGICIQTRLVRAIDIDIEDPAQAQRVRDVIEMAVGQLPMRYRKDSGKCLLAFKMEGTFPKRVIRTEAGIVEFLANGQQFIASGTHPKGERYQWAGGIPATVPYLTAAEFDALWGALATSFGTSSTVGRVGVAPGIARDAGDADDEVLSFLEATGRVLWTDTQGRAHLTCPFASEHTTGDAADPGASSTSYFPAGVGGFEQGHFKCLHAHCAERTDDDFLQSIGFTFADDFDDLGPVPATVGALLDQDGNVLELPAFSRDRVGAILPTVRNVQMALDRSDICGASIGYDAFKDELMLAPHEEPGAWRMFTDADYVRIRIRLETGGFKPIGRELIRDVVCLCAEEHKFDSAQLWLGGLAWDGVPRVDTFWQTYFGAPDSDYTRSCSHYIWTAMAGRVLEPGVKADMVPILVGEQGVGKSTGVAAMVPDPAFFTEVSLSDREDDIARRMRGKLIGEIGELRGLHSREIEHVKAFASRTHEEWVPKFKEFTTNFPRRLVFIGTTNQEEFLADETGNRRWLPIRVGEVDRVGIARDLEQLWAEGAALFIEGGVAFHQAQSLAEDVHADHMIQDPWQDAIEAWLETDGNVVEGVKNKNTYFQLSDVLQTGLGFSVSQLARNNELRVGKVLRGMGYDKILVRRDGAKGKVWAHAENRKLGQTGYARQCAALNEAGLA